MTKTITFKQEEKKVYEVVKEVREMGFNVRGSLRAVLRTGGNKNITEVQAKVLGDFADTTEKLDKITHSLDRRNSIELEVKEVELTLAEAMVKMNDEGEEVIVSHFGDKMTVSRWTDLEDLMSIGINDFDDLNDAKFFVIQ